MERRLAIIFSLCWLGKVAIAAPPIGSAQSSYGRVTDVQGHVFGVCDERTFNLKIGYKLPDKTEIITEEGAQVSFMDAVGRQFHLSGAGHVEITDHGIKLNRGYLWIQSFQSKQRLTLRTANALAELLVGEGIFSFDNASGRSQLLAVKGEFKFAHFLDVNRYEILQPGEFSMVDAEHGVPRRATPIGFQSYEKIIALFRGPHRDAMGGAQRLPASAAASGEKLTSGQVDDINADLKKLHVGQIKKKVRRFKAKAKTKGNVAKKGDVMEPGGEKQQSRYPGVVTRVFGLKELEPELERPRFRATPEEGALTAGPRASLRRVRAPASQRVEGQPASPYPWGFEGALRKHLRKTSRQKLEEEGLVEELKYYREDYKVTY